MREYADAQVKLIQKNIPGFKVVRQTRKVLRRAFIGSEILGAIDKPMVPPGYFGWECITGFHDEGKNQFYGIVRSAKDPQRWANKFLSQVMFLMNSQSKGGIMAEKGAFDSERQAEESWAKTDAITWMKKGALQGQSPMVLPKARRRSSRKASLPSTRHRRSPFRRSQACRLSSSARARSIRLACWNTSAGSRR
jgi:hypothetical protein